MVYEPDDEKAYYHQVGQGNLPARKIVEVNEATRRSIDRIFAEWLNALRRRPAGASL